MAISKPFLLVVLATALSRAFASRFPYAISIANNGPVLLDTPVTVNATLIPIKSVDAVSSNVTASAHTPKKYYFHWIDNLSPFDCPHRIVRTRSVSPLSSVYNATYHHQPLRCPPVFGRRGERTVGVAVYDHPDFDPEWSTPLATAVTIVRLLSEIDLRLRARPMAPRNIPDHLDPTGEDYFLAAYPMVVNAYFSDPYHIIEKCDGFFKWSISPRPSAIPAWVMEQNNGQLLPYTFEDVGRYTWGVDLDVTLKTPEYPGMPTNSSEVPRNFTKRAATKRTFVVLERVRNLRVSPKTKAATIGKPWTLGVSLNGTFPIVVNWSIEFVHHGPESNRSKTPATLVGNRSCLYKNRENLPVENDDGDDDDILPRVCDLPIKFNFTHKGAYRVTVHGYNKVMRMNRLSVHQSLYVWVYPPEETVPLFTLVLPFLFITFGLGCCVFTYVQFANFHDWGQQSVEIADFEVSFSYENESGARVRPKRTWKRWFKEAYNNLFGFYGFGKSRRHQEDEYPSPHCEPSEKTSLKKTRFRRTRFSRSSPNEKTAYIPLTSTDSKELESRAVSASEKRVELGFQDVDYQRSAMSDTATDGDDEEHEIDDEDLEFYQHGAYQYTPPRPTA